MAKGSEICKVFSSIVWSTYHFPFITLFFFLDLIMFFSPCEVTGQGQVQVPAYSCWYYTCVQKDQGLVIRNWDKHLRDGQHLQGFLSFTHPWEKCLALRPFLSTCPVTGDTSTLQLCLNVKGLPVQVSPSFNLFLSLVELLITLTINFCIITLSVVSPNHCTDTSVRRVSKFCCLKKKGKNFFEFLGFVLKAKFFASYFSFSEFPEAENN